MRSCIVGIQLNPKLEFKFYLDKEFGALDFVWNMNNQEMARIEANRPGKIARFFFIHTSASDPLTVFWF